MIKRLKLLPLLILSVLCLGLGYGLASGSLPVGVQLPFLPAARAATSDAVATKAKAKEPDPAPGLTLSTKERVVTLADPQQLRYLKTEVVLEFELSKDQKPASGDAYKKAQDELAKELAPVMPAIEDAITTELAKRTAADIATSSGKERLKADLLDRLNRLPLERQITNVYFTQFIIQ
jgi:flagellar FliL protein